MQFWPLYGLPKQSHFVKRVSSWLPGLNCSCESIFIPVNRILVVENQISVTGLACPPSHMNTSKFSQKKQELQV